MKTKKKKLQVGNIIAHILIASALVGLLLLGYWSLQSDNSDKFRGIERLRGDGHHAVIVTPQV
jgi:hypothetical protein